MCGICGMVGFEDKHLLQEMCEVITHRGPDDSGLFIDKNIGLGMRRLSIIDIKGGHQPISNETESVWVVFNGEIYNFLELKDKLEEQGHRFSTSCDTEVLVHLYEEYGDCFVSRLRGMFSFALWDSESQRLLLGRDRLGIKPLYYARLNDTLLFGSEIKSILQYDVVERKVSIPALHNYLTFQYVPGPLTLFENVLKLQPGSILIYDHGQINITKYWDIMVDSTVHQPEEIYTESILRLLRESVRIRLMSEVPLGVYLSGGLDSSTIVALMAELSNEPIKTFTAGFGHATDEFKYAQTIADFFETDHHELLIGANMMDELPKVVWHFDEPNADPAALPTFLLSEAMKKHATVILVGEGGDETFAGYEKYGIALLNEKYRKLLPKPFKKSVIPMMSYVMSKVVKGEYAKYLGFFSEFSKIMDDNLQAYKKMSALGFDEAEKDSMYTDGVKTSFTYSDPVQSYIKPGGNLFNGMILFDMKVWLCDRLLMKVDKMTMANSIEARVPFLDHELVTFCNRLPVGSRLNKRILKKAMVGLLPKQILKRKKHAFVVPISTWFERDYRNKALEVLERLHRTEYFKRDYMYNILKQTGKIRTDHKLMTLLIFDIWHRLYIESDNLRNPSLSIDNLLD